MKHYPIPDHLRAESPISQAIAQHLAETPDVPWLGLDFVDADGVRVRCFQRLNSSGRADIAATYCGRSWSQIHVAKGVTDAQRADFMAKCHALTA